MIADDIRGATVYKPQDTSAIAKLMLASKPFDVDSIDQARQSSSSSSGASSSTSSSSSSSNSSTNGESDDTLPLGLNGSNVELFIDVTRLPSQEELFSNTTGYTNAQSPVTSGGGAAMPGSASGDGDVNPPTDLKTIHYYVRPGEAIEPGSAAFTSLAPEAQASVGGLAREEVPRQMRLFSEQQGTNDSLTTVGKLVAPEVAQIQFRYFDGSQLSDEWDMRETGKLPVAIEVCVWLKSSDKKKSDTEGTSISTTDTLGTLNSAHEYREIVYLPMASLSAASAGAGADSSTSSTDSSSSSDSSSSDSSSGTDSAFDAQQ